MGGYGGIWGDMGDMEPMERAGTLGPIWDPWGRALHWFHIPPYPPISHNIPHIPSDCIKIIYIYICISIIFRVPWISCIFQTRFRFYFFSRIPGSGYLVGISCGRNSTVGVRSKTHGQFNS